MNNIPTKIILIGGGGVLFFILIAIMIISSTNKPSAPDETSPSPTIADIGPTKIIPPVVKDAPTVAPTKGGGLDESSTIIHNSITEIQKIYPYLPYDTSFTSSTGVGVSILMPKQSLQTNRWTLKTQIFGINYNTSPSQADYEIMRKSFKEAAERVFAWVKQKDADPSRIIFIWGDKKFIQNQAEKWLRS